VKDLAELLTAIGTFAWPVMAAVAFCFLFPFAKGFLSRDKVKIKIGEMEISAEQATEQISNQLKDLQNKVIELEQRALPQTSPQILLSDKKPLVPASERRILWVDDYPSNNAIQIDKLRSEGWSIELATTTSQALEMIAIQKYNLIISDMGRRENGERRPMAGIQLAEKIRATDSKIPIFIFTTHQALTRFKAGVEKAKIDLITNSTVELYQQIEMVTGKAR
jgi:CheY-like chemotaxis protein